MPTWRLELTVKGPVGTAKVEATPPTFEASSLAEALELLARSSFPDNDFVRTIGVSLTRDNPGEGMTSQIGFREV